MTLERKLKIEIVFGFSSSGSDIDNGLKPFLDCIQKKYGINDNKVYELNVKKEVVKKGNEFIEFKIKQLQNYKPMYYNTTNEKKMSKRFTRIELTRH